MAAAIGGGRQVAGGGVRSSGTVVGSAAVGDGWWRRKAAVVDDVALGVASPRKTETNSVRHIPMAPRKESSKVRCSFPLVCNAILWFVYSFSWSCASAVLEFMNLLK